MLPSPRRRGHLHHRCHTGKPRRRRSRPAPPGRARSRLSRPRGLPTSAQRPYRRTRTSSRQNSSWTPPEPTERQRTASQLRPTSRAPFPANGALAESSEHAASFGTTQAAHRLRPSRSLTPPSQNGTSHVKLTAFRSEANSAPFAWREQSGSCGPAPGRTRLLLLPRSGSGAGCPPAPHRFGEGALRT